MQKNKLKFCAWADAQRKIVLRVRFYALGRGKVFPLPNVWYLLHLCRGLRIFLRDIFSVLGGGDFPNPLENFGKEKLIGVADGAGDIPDS